MTVGQGETKVFGDSDFSYFFHILVVDKTLKYTSKKSKHLLVFHFQLIIKYANHVELHIELKVPPLQNTRFSTFW